MNKLQGLNWRLLPTQAGILLTFTLIPLWWRLSEPPLGFAPLYATRFVVFLSALATVAVWLIGGFPGFVRFRRDRLSAIWGLILLLLVLWMYVSTGWAFAEAKRPDVALNATLQFAVVTLFALTVACASPPLHLIVGALIFGLCWNAALAGAQVALQGSVGLYEIGEFVLNPARSGVSVIGAERWLRPYGLLPHPNMLGGYLCVALLATVYGLTVNVQWIRLTVLSIVGVGLWALLLTFSRGSWLGFAAGAFALLPLLLRLKRANAGLWIGVIFALGIAAVFFATYRDLIFTRVGIDMQSTELFSAAERGTLTIAGYEAILAQPLFGAGAGNAPWWAATYLHNVGSEVRGNYAHQVWVAAWSDLGVVGLMFLFMAMIFGVELALRAIRSGRGDVRGRAVLLAGYIALCIAGLFDYYVWGIIHFQVLWWGLLAAALHFIPAQGGIGSVEA